MVGIMKIGIFTESFLPQVNGVVTAICNSARVLSKKHKVEIFTVGRGPRKAAGCMVHRFRGMKLPTYRDYKFFIPGRRTWKLLSNTRLDVVHVRSSLPFGLIAMRFARKRGVPLVGTFDTPISDYVHYVPVLGKIRIAKGLLSNTALKYMIWFYNRCDVVIAPSNVAKEWLKRAGCSSRVVVVSNGVDTSRFIKGKVDKRLRGKLCPDNGLLLVHVGRMSGEKSVDVLLRAAKNLKAMGTEFKLVVVGKGPVLASLKQMSRSLGVDGCVKFVGFIPDSQLPKYYASADAFVTASTVETEGIVMLEAMASGLPVIGANAGATPEIIKNGVNGLLFGPGDHKDLVKRILRLTDARLRKRMSANAVRVSMQYSIKKVVQIQEKIYKQVVRIKN